MQGGIPTVGVPVQTRIPAKVFAELERLAALQGISAYELVRELIVQGVQARLGCRADWARLERERADLQAQEAAALEELAQKAQERATAHQLAAQAEAEARRWASMHPADRVVAFLNQGDGEQALAEYRSHGAGVQNAIVKHVQAQDGLPGAEAFLAEAGKGDSE